MLGRRFFLQFCLLSAFGLTLFAILAALAWNVFLEDQFLEKLFRRTSVLAEIVLPPPGSPGDMYTERLDLISEKLAIDTTIYDKSGELIAASDEVAFLPLDPPLPGEWTPTDRQTRWTTVLSDGRMVILDIRRLQAPNEMLAVTLTLVTLAIVISLLLYPLVRRITRRLERLQTEVEKIGAGDLSSRVTVEGCDEIAKLALSFNKSTETIEELVNRQKLLLANASHELRTPLARIRMGIELIERKNTVERHDELRRDVFELDALIDDLITMTRFDVGERLRSCETVNLTELARGEARRTDGCSVIGPDVQVFGDARMLKRMVRNLVDNANKHGKPPIVVEFVRSSSNAKLHVTDQGNGIAPDDREKVFEPFFRAGDRQNIPGYGLGLSLVARIADAHKSTVCVAPGPRSRISVTFPTEVMP